MLSTRSWAVIASVAVSITHPAVPLADGEELDAQALTEFIFELRLNDREAAHAYQAKGHVQTARFEFEAAFESSLALETLSERDTRNIMFNLGKLYTTMGRTDEGLELLQANGLENRSFENHQEIIRALWIAGRAEEALSWTDLTARLMPETAQEMQIQRAALQIQLQRFDELEDGSGTGGLIAGLATSPAAAAGRGYEAFLSLGTFPIAFPGQQREFRVCELTCTPLTSNPPR